MDCNFVWNQVHDFNIKWMCSTSLIRNHNDFRWKLSNVKLNCHFIAFTLKVQNSVTQYNWVLKVVSHFSAIWLITVISLNKPWNLISCCFSKAESFAGKRCHLEHKMVQFVNKLHLLEPIRLQGSQVILKWM